MTDHPIFAALYDRMCAPAEAGGLAERRRSLLAGARGRVLEIGAGTGHNLRYYTAATELVALEPDGAMRRRLEARLGECPVPVKVVPAGIDDADLEPASFDTVVSTLTFCTVPDMDTAAARVADLLAPDGRFLFLEHAHAPGWRGVSQRLVTPAWRRVIPGCRLDRDVTMAIRRAGLLIGDCERFRLPLVPVLADHGVAGEAHRPLVSPPAEPGLYPLRRGVRA